MVYQIAPGNWAWACRCGQKQQGFAAEMFAQAALDEHMRSDAW